MTSRGRARRIAGLLAALVLYAAASGGLQILRGAHVSGFGAFPDEPSHVVTGLMARDWIAAAASSGVAEPVAYARDYYVHYPKVGIGQWPPGFYALQAGWTLAFGDSRLSLVLLSSALAAAVAAVLFAVLRGRIGAFAAFATGLLFLLLPLSVELAGTVMTEVPLALLCLAAALAFGRFLDDGRARSVWVFALLAALAALTKGSGLLLALVPPLAIAASGRFDRLRSPHLWLACAAVAATAGPWYVATLPFARATWAGGGEPSLAYASAALPHYLLALARTSGAFVLGAALVGLVARLRGPEPRGIWASAVALLAAVLVFHSIVPSSIEERHLLLAAPPLVLLAGAGVGRLAELVPRPASRTAPALSLALLGLFALEAFRLPRKDWHGYQALARDVAMDPALASSLLLVSSDSLGEGLLVSEMALADRERPSRIVLRASKVLADTDWLGKRYVPRFDTPDELGAWLDEIPVGLIAVDLSARRKQWYAHQDLLLELVRSNPRRWVPYATYDVVRDGVRHAAALRVHRLVGHEERPLHEEQLARTVTDRLGI